MSPLNAGCNYSIRSAGAKASSDKHIGFYNNMHRKMIAEMLLACVRYSSV